MKTSDSPILKAVTRINQGKNRIISIPHAWCHEKGNPDQIHMVIGNLIIISTIEDFDTLVKAISCLEKAGLFIQLEGAEMELVSHE